MYGVQRSLSLQWDARTDVNALVYGFYVLTKEEI